MGLRQREKYDALNPEQCLDDASKTVGKVGRLLSKVRTSSLL